MKFKMKFDQPLRHNPRALVLSAAFFFTAMAACVKAVSPKIPLYETVFFRSIISVLILGYLMRRRGIRFRARNFPLMMTRSLSGLAAMSCNFYALGHLSFGDSAMLVHTFPIFVAILSFIFLGERPTKKLLLLIVISWIGILLILRPHLNFLNFAGFIALLAAIFSAIVVVVIHQTHETDPSLRIALYFTGICTFVSLPIMLQHFEVPNFRETALLIGSGLFGTAGQIVMTKAYGLEDVSRLSPLAYIGVILSFIMGVLFWNEVPNTWSLVGGLVVISCCIQIARLEKPAPVIESS
jgi:drug/metabolite transporter (DMT)-like permease